MCVELGQLGRGQALLAALFAALVALCSADTPTFLTTFEFEGEVWSAYESHAPATKGKAFFVASDGTTTWVDPRKVLISAESRMTGAVALLIALGVVTVLAALFCAYLAYNFPKYWASLGVKSKKKRQTLAAKYSPAASAASQRPRATSTSPTRNASSSPVRTRANGKKSE